MLSQFLGNSLLDMAFAGYGFAPSGDIKICLYTVMPTAAGGGTEVTGGGYAPVVVANDLTTFPHAVNRSKTIAIDVIFTAPSSAWTEITGIVLIDNDTADLLIYSEFAAPFFAPVGSPLEFLAGSISLTAFN